MGAWLQDSIARIDQRLDAALIGTAQDAKETCVTREMQAKRPR